jgi:poly(hydroxyalkanoate) depolymerase family esterase
MKAQDFGLWAQPTGRLVETLAFGSNPGGLRMHSYAPPGLPAGAPLIVALHGCTQNARAYDHGTGWSALADAHGFAVLFPEQQPSNSANLCFNWFKLTDIRRDRGEALSIRQMIDAMGAAVRSDPRRIYVSGLSAGGAMASVMLAAYPELFAGGAIIAGLPYGCAVNVPEALRAMSQASARSPQALGALVRGASAHAGPWPTVSVWHGAADTTVVPENAAEILKQWAEVHGVEMAQPDSTETTSHHSRRVWQKGGKDVIEFYRIAGMGHGVPVAPPVGNAGAFFLDVGLSSSARLVSFWGIADRPAAMTATETPAVAPTAAAAVGTASKKAETKHGRFAAIDGIIRRALGAAGLIKPDVR